METVVRRNERSWAIEVISKINEIASANDIAIKKAGGESTVSTRIGNTMFPDVILYGNTEQSVILQGWELKMPDVPIEDETFIKDAQRKAVALNLNSCIIWNFTYAVLYIRNEDGVFEKIRQWDETSFIHTRVDVQTYRKDWERLLKLVLLEINNYFLDGRFRQTLIGDVISSTTLITLIQRNQKLVADMLRERANRNSVISAYIDNWWSSVKREYEHDETDMYSAYAKSIILNWANRITFAHIIKYQQNSARLVDNLGFDSSPAEGNNIFYKITQKCDFYNVFLPSKHSEILPLWAWQDLMEYSLFLKENGIAAMDQKMLQNILEGSVNLTKRVLNGQFTTPYELAKILVRLTVIDWKENFLDCCCGTGTIPKAVIEMKKEKYGAKLAVETVWASDKYRYPLQVANISMVSADTINLANRLFQKNALALNVSDEIKITSPETGEEMLLHLPSMGAIASNLPFVEFEKLSTDDLDVIFNMIDAYHLDSRSDLYFYIALKIADVLKPGGRLGIITSNSWLGTGAGSKFVKALSEKYCFQQVHISGRGKWFKNADVVATIIILKKKDDILEGKIQFFLWKKTLEQFNDDKYLEDKLVNSSLLGEELDASVASLSEYSLAQIEELLSFNISYNSFFHKIDWLNRFSAAVVPINEIFHVFRGNRRGWDAMFFPKKGEHHIEGQYLQKVLINARSVDYLVAKADSDAFCCDVEIEKLKEWNHSGALEWINKFIDQKNGVGKPLPEVLKRKGIQWYELQRAEVAELFTMMNPDQRLFFAKFEGAPAFVNQRLIGLTHRGGFGDMELCHALLNSVFTMFSIESSGFGRGLGVLDINKDSLARCRMFDPRILSKENRDRIVGGFGKIKSRKILKVADELCSADRLEFEKLVFRAYGLEEELENVVQSLQSMQRTRAAVRERG